MSRCWESRSQRRHE